MSCYDVLRHVCHMLHHFLFLSLCYWLVAYTTASANPYVISLLSAPESNYLSYSQTIV